ncbi:MAG: hypothetical protein V1495_11280 [Pseudomonadota bacterium]
MKRKSLSTVLVFFFAMATLLTFSSQRSEAQTISLCGPSASGPAGTYPQFKRYSIDGFGKSMKLFVYTGDSGRAQEMYIGYIPVTDPAFDSIQASVLMVAKSPEMFEFTMGTTTGTDNKICRVDVKPRFFSPPIAIATPTPLR